jgi:hypothetical protein
MDYCVEFGCPRSGTTYVEEVIGTLRSSQRKQLPILPRVNLNILGNPSVLERDELPKEIHGAFQESMRRGVRKFLSNRYNSRFLALESWWRTPRQLDQLWHVVRPGRRPLPNLFIYRETHLSLAPSLAFEAFPDGKIMYLYRDGRDVANSLVESYNALTDDALTNLTSVDVRLGRDYDHRRVPWWVEEGKDQAFIEASQYGRAIWFWAFVVDRCESYFSSLETPDSDRLLKIQYEDFMHNPHTWGERICEHLDVNPTAAFHRHLDRARTSSIGKYQHRPEHEIEEATRIASGALKRLGYL